MISIQHHGALLVLLMVYVLFAFKIRAAFMLLQLEFTSF